MVRENYLYFYFSLWETNEYFLSITHYMYIINY